MIEVSLFNISEVTEHNGNRFDVDPFYDKTKRIDTPQTL